VEQTFEPLRVLAGLRARGVHYVLVGDLAEMAHGAAPTADRVEVCVSADDDDIDKLGVALMALGAEPMGEPDDPHRVTFSTNAGVVECMELAREDGFADMERRATQMHVGHGVIVNVAAPEDLKVHLLANDDLQGAVRAAALAEGRADEAVRSQDEFGPEAEGPGGFRAPLRRVWKAFEDVDRFMNDLNDGGPGRRRGAER
jgi:hypothetical protein